MMLNPEYIGFFAAILITPAFLPQAHKIWKSKTADGLSLTMYTIMGVGTLTWLLFGIGIQSPSAITANTISILIIICIITFIFRFKK